MSPRISSWLILSGLLLGLLAACTPEVTVTPSPTLTASPAITRYVTSTPTPTPSGMPPTTTPLPSPTPTPVTYAVQKDDDMFGIALRFGVGLPALKTANPKINPYFMGVGTVLVIPVTPGATNRYGLTATPTVTPTPNSIQLGQPVCYPSEDGGLWCIVVARNQQSQAVENLSVAFRLGSKSSDKLSEQTAYTPLNLLPGDDSLPIAVYFPAPAPKEYAVEVQAKGALPLAADDLRYPTADILEEKVSIEGDYALASGKVVLKQSEAKAGEIWVLAVAFGQQDQVVGVRKWESTAVVSNPDEIPFSLNVYSLGPVIQRVELRVEAHAPRQ